MNNAQDAATLVCVVLAVFAGVGIPWARSLDRRDAAEQARKNQVTEGN